MISGKLKGASLAVLAASVLAACTATQLEELNTVMKDSFENSISASFGTGVEVTPDRAPAPDTLSISYTSALFDGYTSEAGQCTRALAKACSDSFGGLSAPFCVSEKAAMCGVYPKTPSGSVAECFEDVGEGRLKSGACREAGLGTNVTVTQSSATFPFGPSRPVYEQYQVMVEEYSNQAFRDLYFKAEGSTMCTGAMTRGGDNLRCQIEAVQQNMVDAAGYTCEFKFNPLLDFNKAMDARTEVGKKIDHQCSVKPTVLESMVDVSTKRAYAFK